MPMTLVSPSVAEMWTARSSRSIGPTLERRGAAALDHHRAVGGVRPSRRSRRRLDAGALGGVPAHRGHRGAAVDQEADRPAVDLARRPRNGRHRRGGCAARRPASPAPASPLTSASIRLPSARKSSRARTTAKPTAKISTQASAIFSVWPIGARRTARPLPTRTQQQNEINEAKGLVAVVHKSTSIPS